MRHFSKRFQEHVCTFFQFINQRNFQFFRQNYASQINVNISKCKPYLHAQVFPEEAHWIFKMATRLKSKQFHDKIIFLLKFFTKFVSRWILSTEKSFLLIAKSWEAVATPPRLFVRRVTLRLLSRGVTRCFDCDRSVI